MRYPYSCVALGALMLAACGQEPADESVAGVEPPAMPPAEVTAETESTVPTGRLGDAVVPSRYRLELTILPDQDDFSGVTEIDVQIAAATRSIFLHGNGLKVDKVQLTTANGDSYAGRYEQVHDTGVARIDFDDDIPSGTATLRVSYSAPFQQNSQGL
jgi:hypothetical protein